MDEADDKTYCICQTSDFYSGLVACDGCSQYFHPGCLGTSESDALNENDVFLCNECIINDTGNVIFNHYSNPDSPNKKRRTLTSRKKYQNNVCSALESNAVWQSSSINIANNPFASNKIDQIMFESSKMNAYHCHLNDINDNVDDIDITIDSNIDNKANSGEKNEILQELNELKQNNDIDDFEVTKEASGVCSLCILFVYN